MFRKFRAGRTLTEVDSVESERAIGPKEVGRLFGVSARAVNEWIRKGMFQEYGIYPFRTPGGEWRFYRDEVEAAIERQRGLGGISLAEEMLRLSPVPETRIVAVANQKGGVGKTTITVNLAYALAKLHGHRCLVVDLDPQGNASLHMGFTRDRSLLAHSQKLRPPKHIVTDIWDLGDTPGVGFGQVVEHYDDLLQIAPIDEDGLHIEHAVQVLMLSMANLNRNMTIAQLGERIKRFFSTLPTKLHAYLAEQRKVWPIDWVLIDTPPTLGTLALSAILASDAYIIPVEPDPFSQMGSGVYRELVDEWAAMVNRQVHCLGYVINNKGYDSSLRALMRQELRAQQGSLVFDTELRQDSQYSSATAEFEPVLQFIEKSGRKNSNAAEDFARLCSEFLTRMEQFEATREAAIGQDSSS